MIRRVWRALYRRLVADRVSGDTHLLRFLATAGVTATSEVLDVGCGEGTLLLRMCDELGVRAEGIEINPETAERVRARGFACHAPDEPALSGRTWDALVMSHVIEHLRYDELVPFLARYVGWLRIGGALVIATPLLHPRFYDDCDHVRPYPPEALEQVFGARGQQVQLQLPYQLELMGLWYRRSSFELAPAASMLVGRAGVVAGLVSAVNRLLLAAFYLTAGALGRRTGWVGLYRRVA